MTFFFVPGNQKTVPEYLQEFPQETPGGPTGFNCQWFAKEPRMADGK